MPTPTEDSLKPCTDCAEGTYVLYDHGWHCRYCGQPKNKQPVKTVTSTRKAN